MEKDREKRYQSILDMRLDLEQFQEKFGSNSQTKSFSSYAFANPGKDKNNWKLPASAFFILIVFILASGFYFYSDQIFGNPKNEVKNFNYRHLTSNVGDELFPRLSPDRKTFLYSSGNYGARDIFFQRVDGAKPVNLTENSGSDDIHAVYSPDGETIAFHSDRDGNGGGLYVMGATGESVRRLSDLGFNPSWSPDGKEIVYSTLVFNNPSATGFAGELWVVNVRTGKSVKLKQMAKPYNQIGRPRDIELLTGGVMKLEIAISKLCR